VVNHEYRIYVGIDWATEAHKACVLIPLILVGRPILPPLRRHHAPLDKWWGVPPQFAPSSRNASLVTNCRFVSGGSRTAPDLEFYERSEGKALVGVKE
jgi:hypothetical protein